MKRAVYLILEKSTPHLKVSTRDLENSPAKLKIQFPSDEGEQKGEEGDDTWNSNQERLDI